MIKTFDNLINLGISPETPFRLQNRLRIFNSSVVIIIAICLINSFIGIAGDYIIPSLVTFFYLPCLFLGLWFVSQKKYNAAFHLVMISGGFFIGGFSFFFGMASMNFVYFLFMPFGSMILFDSKKVIFWYFFWNLLLLVTVMIAFFLIEPYYEPNPFVHVFAVLNLVFCSGLIFMGINLFKTENQGFQEKINQQKEILAEKNREIVSSISYAKRIQDALLNGKTVLKESFPNSFVFFRPRDIVSGDFYFVKRRGDYLWLGVGDCTGHGVPGAFMTLLGISFLTEITSSADDSGPARVLDLLRHKIISSLNPENGREGSRDGMDIALAKIHLKGGSSLFAGANNHFLVLEEGRFTETCCDRFPVGLHVGNEKPFREAALVLKPGSRVYSFTDGISDQFGGGKGKKLRYKNVYAWLLENQNPSLEKQGEDLELFFEKWKGNFEQLDDVLVAGIEIS